MTTPEIGRYADEIMTEIGKDIASGQVPATVASFSELHDHVDANDYGSQAVPQGGMTWDEYLEALNAIETEVDRRIKAGRLR